MTSDPPSAPAMRSKMRDALRVGPVQIVEDEHRPSTGEDVDHGSRAASSRAASRACGSSARRRAASRSSSAGKLGGARPGAARRGGRGRRDRPARPGRSCRRAGRTRAPARAWSCRPRPHRRRARRPASGRRRGRSWSSWPDRPTMTGLRPARPDSMGASVSASIRPVLRARLGGWRCPAAAVQDSARWDGFRFRPGDIVISTPPKCGTTWTQMICALLVFQTPDLPAPLGELSPWLDMVTRPRTVVSRTSKGRRTDGS